MHVTEICIAARYYAVHDRQLLGWRISGNRKYDESFPVVIGDFDAANAASHRERQ